MFGSAQGLILQLKTTTTMVTTMGAIQIGNPLPLRTLILMTIISSQFYLDIRSQLENDFMASLRAEVSDDGGEEEAIRPLPWYPDNLAWHSNFSRMQLRKNQNLERFRPSFLMNVQSILCLTCVLHLVQRHSSCLSIYINRPDQEPYLMGWNLGLGNGLHGLQVQIAMRGLSLLKVGGRMVYPTCSMNPVENEAVVAEILRRCGGSVELLDVSDELPQLVRQPGLRKWKVRDKGVWLASYKDVPKCRHSVIVPGMFPSGKSYMDTTDDNHRIEHEEKHENNGSGNFEDNFSPMENLQTPADEAYELSDFPLERCMRIMPHDQNTGAFFIAVIHKHSPLPAIQERPNNMPDNLCSRNDKLLVNTPNQTTQYELESNSIDVTNEKSSEVASETDLVGDEPDGAASGPDPSIAFEDPISEQERQSSREGRSAPCIFRISSEGLPAILPYITEQILYASPVDFNHLLQYKTIKFADFINSEFGEMASNLLLGCCVVVLRKGVQAALDPIKVDESTIALGCWRGRASLTVMVTALDCQELLERLSSRIEIEKGPSVIKDEPSNLKMEELHNMTSIEHDESLEMATDN